MRRPRRKILGFVLTIAISLTLPHVVFAGHSFSRAAKFRAAPKLHPQRSLSRPFHGTTGSLSFGRLREQQVRKFRIPKVHPFHHFGFSDVVGPVSEQHVIIIQEFQPGPVAESKEPAKDRVYVAPRWVEGEYGVQVLEPGYWTEPPPAAKR